MSGLYPRAVASETAITSKGCAASRRQRTAAPIEAGARGRSRRALETEHQHVSRQALRFFCSSAERKTASGIDVAMLKTGAIEPTPRSLAIASGGRQGALLSARPARIGIQLAFPTGAEQLPTLSFRPRPASTTSATPTSPVPSTQPRFPDEGHSGSDHLLAESSRGCKHELRPFVSKAAVMSLASGSDDAREFLTPWSIAARLAHSSGRATASRSARRQACRVLVLVAPSSTREAGRG
jgi:hypothetical protein